MSLYSFFSAMKWFIQLMETVVLVVNKDDSSG